MTSFSEYNGWANLSKVRLNSKGQDEEGITHPKGGMPLYKLSIKIEDKTYKWSFRAYDREDAVWRAKNRLPNAKFRKVIKSL
jgi:hypothetical protein